MRLVYGVGVNDKTRPFFVGKPLKEYNAWRNMIFRCNSNNKNYNGCTISDNFKHYSYFYDWCQNQIGFNQEKFNLDKDLLIKGNRDYSENNCVFIPQEINKLIIKKEFKRGEYPIGVYFDKKVGMLKAQINMEGRRPHLGYFHDEISAFQAYKKAKEKYIKELANKWKGQIDPRAYDALMRYEVEITD